MISQDKIDQIEQYLNYEMAEEDRVLFESQINQNEELAAELSRRELAHKALDFVIAENLRSELKAMEQQDTKVVSLGSRSRRSFQLAIAASVLVLIGAFFMFLPSKSSSPYELAMSAYESPDFTLRSGDADTPSELTIGKQALENGDYQAAIAALTELDPALGYSTNADFYLGHANFLSGNFAAAQSYFDNVASGNDMRFREEAEWYAALSCLALNNNCVEILEDISNDSNHSYIEQAKAIMLQLEN